MKAAKRPRRRTELSAFLSAARSPLLYISGEVKGTPQQAWYQSEVAEPIVRFFRKRRNVNTHESPVVPSSAYKVTLTEAIGLEDGAVGVHGTQEGEVVSGGPNGASASNALEGHPPAVISYRYFFPDWRGPEDVSSLCEIYLARVAAIVELWRTKRGELPPANLGRLSQAQTIESTLKKLREAAFFLERLDAARLQAWKEPATEEVDFYFSAFVSAGRSITWVLQDEEKERYDATWTEWEKRQSVEDRIILELVQEERNAEVKQGAGQTRTEWSLEDWFGRAPASRPRSSSSAAHYAAVLVPVMFLTKVGVPTFYKKREDVVEYELLPVCRRYCELMKEFVDEFLKRWAAKA